MAVMVLNANKVSYGYRADVLACDQLSLQLGAGELVCVLGPNGAGKSTFLSMVAGLKVPDSGYLEVMGKNPSLPETRKHLGVTPQDTAFPKTVRVKEVLDFVLAQYGAELSVDLLEALNLKTLMPRLMGGLSGGERRRVGLACALCAKPDLIVLDEPTAGLDLPSRYSFFVYLKKLVKDSGKTVLFSTHHLDEVEQLAERVLVLFRGKVVREGRVEDIRRQFGHRRIRFRSGGPVQVPAPWSVQSQGGVHDLMVNDAEVFVRWLVGSQIPFSDLEVQPASLEEIFVQIVSAT